MLAVWETWVRFLGWEVTLEKEIATHSSILGEYQADERAGVARLIWRVSG